MRRRISIVAFAILLLSLLWFFFAFEKATPRDRIVALPCELIWSVAGVSASKNTEVSGRVDTFVPVVGQLKTPDERLWSGLCNSTYARMYPDGIVAPHPLPEEEWQMLLDDARNGRVPDAAVLDRTHVVRILVRSVPDGPSTPSARFKQTKGLSVAVGRDGETAFFAGLLKLPEVPGEYWIQLLCEFTTKDTYNEFTAFSGNPVAEFRINVTQ